MEKAARLSARATVHVLAGDAAAAAAESEEAHTVIETRLQERPHDLDSWFSSVGLTSH